MDWSVLVKLSYCNIGSGTRPCLMLIHFLALTYAGVFTYLITSCYSWWVWEAFKQQGVGRPLCKLDLHMIWTHSMWIQDTRSEQQSVCQGWCLPGRGDWVKSHMNHCGCCQHTGICHFHDTFMPHPHFLRDSRHSLRGLSPPARSPT